MPIVRHAQKEDYLRLLIHLLRNVEIASKYRGLGLCCFENPIDGYYLVNDSDA